MSLLVAWLGEHYDENAKATPEGRQQPLEQVCKMIRSAGHERCTVSRIYSKIKCLKSEAEAASDSSYRCSAAFDRYKDLLMDLFGHHATRGTDRHGSLDDDRDSSMSGTVEDDSEGEDVEMSEEDESDDESNETSDVEDVAMAGEADNKAPKRTKLSWTKPSKADGPSKMEILVPWLVTHYATDVRPSGRGKIKQILEPLLAKMKEAGHEDCTLAQIRSKIDCLQREATGKKAKSEVFERYEQILLKLFRDGLSREELERYISSTGCLNEEDSDEAMHEGDDEARTVAVASVEDLEVSAEGELLPPNRETASQGHEDEPDMDTTSNQARPAQPGDLCRSAWPFPEREESKTENVVGSQASEAEAYPEAHMRSPPITPEHASVNAVDVMETLAIPSGDDREAQAGVERNHTDSLMPENEFDAVRTNECCTRNNLGGAAEVTRVSSKSHPPEDADMDAGESGSATATDNAMEVEEVSENNYCNRRAPAPQPETHPQTGSIPERAQSRAYDGAPRMPEACQERAQPDQRTNSV
jgi:hypothetical protein